MNLSGLITLVIIATIVGGFVWFGYRKFRSSLRQAKGIERGLKMVPLRIHLPPTSDDTEVGSRDVRDVIEEKISQAETLYNVISSTATKGFKSNFYGQRHMAFEMVAAKGEVHFYVAVPVVLEAVVRQAILSAYPTAHLEEVEEHNIFLRDSNTDTVAGGELTLKENYPYPIATFKDLKRDVMIALLNALGGLEESDGAALQIMLRPARDGWEKQAKSLAQDKRDGKEKNGFSWKSLAPNKEILQLLWKPPEAGEDDGGSSQQNKLSNLEQATVDAIEQKTRSPAYETLIRVVAASNSPQRSSGILHNIVATFSLFNAQGLNGFTFSEAKDMEKFVTAFIFRFFPPEVDNNILNSIELATIFHLPDSQFSPTSKLQRQASKQVDGPYNSPKHGLLLGYNIFRGVKKEIRLTDDDKRRHMYMVGQTGTGKSSLLENLALQDMLDGKGFAFIDPHGDAVESLISMVPAERTEDVIYFNPGDMDNPLGLNIFEYYNEDQKDFLIQEAITMLYKLYDPEHQGIIGPRYENIFRNSALLLMADPAGSTFIDIPKLFRDDNFVKEKLKHVKDQSVYEFWTKEIPASKRSNDFGEVTAWFVSKFGAFLSNQMMRNIIGQTKSSFDLRDIMDNRKILLVNLSKGKVGELNSNLLGMIFVMKFQAAAMTRSDTPQDQRVDFSLYVDEFQNFSTESFATILSEARKYHLNLIVANQFIGQLTEEIRDAVFGNVGTIISLRSGPTDADFLVKQFSPIFHQQDLVKLPNFNAIVRLMIGGVPTQPFSMATVPPLGTPNPELGSAIKQLSASKHGRPRALVEKEIFKRMETVKPRGSSSSLRRPSSQQSPKPRGVSGSSFLDEWLEKREKAGGATQSKPAARSNMATGSSSPPKYPLRSQPHSASSSASAPPASTNQASTTANNPSPINKDGAQRSDPKNQSSKTSAPPLARSSTHHDQSGDRPVVSVENVDSTLSRKIRTELTKEELEAQKATAQSKDTVSIRESHQELQEGEIFIDEEGNLSNTAD